MIEKMQLQKKTVCFKGCCFIPAKLNFSMEVHEVHSWTIIYLFNGCI